MSRYVQLLMEQGANFSYDIECVDENTNNTANLYGLFVRSQMRKSFANANVAVNFTINNQNLNVGTFSISANANTTANVYAGEYIMDLDVYDLSGNVYRILTGTVSVENRVTR